MGPLLGEGVRIGVERGGGGGAVANVTCRIQEIHGHVACHLTVHVARDLLYMTLSCMLDWEKTTL